MSFRRGSVVTNQSSICEDAQVQKVKNPALLWLRCRRVAATPIQPLAWEPPYAVGVALKKKRIKRNFLFRTLRRLGKDRAQLQLPEVGAGAHTAALAHLPPCCLCPCPPRPPGTGL